MSVTLFKIGGSLLELPELPERLQAVLALRPDSRPLIVVGGGQAADTVRQWDKVHRLGEEIAHWLAIDAMTFNERLIVALLPDAAIVENRNQASEIWRTKGIPILHAAAFLHQEETSVDRLPRSWEVTSDTIAAWIATRWPANELVLLKSCDVPPTDKTCAVDATFPTVAASLPKIGWANLRLKSPLIKSWPSLTD